MIKFFRQQTRWRSNIVIKRRRSLNSVLGEREEEMKEKKESLLAAEIRDGGFERVVRERTAIRRQSRDAGAKRNPENANLWKPKGK